MNMQTIMDEIKAKAEAKAIEMAKLELANWDENHEAQLIKHFGFNSKTTKLRKAQLQKIVG